MSEQKTALDLHVIMARVRAIGLRAELDSKQLVFRVYPLKGKQVLARVPYAGGKDRVPSVEPLHLAGVAVAVAEEVAAKRLSYVARSQRGLWPWDRDGRLPELEPTPDQPEPAAPRRDLPEAH